MTVDPNQHDVFVLRQKIKLAINHYEFFLADAYWLPPDGPPIGPMALQATCTTQRDGTLLHVRQSGWDETSQRWTRYYDIISTGWMLALEKLKTHLEEQWSA